MFDKIMLFSLGKPVYIGPVNSAPEYFSELGYPCRTYTNPSDHFLELITLDTRSFEAEMASLRRINSLLSSFANSELNLLNTETAMSVELIENSHLGKGIWKYPTQWKVWHELPSFLILTYRNMIDQMRSMLLLFFRLNQSIFLPLTLGAFFWQLSGDLESIYDRQGALFYIVIQQACSSILPVIASFQIEKEIYFREHQQGMFSSLTYFLGILCKVP